MAKIKTVIASILNFFNMSTEGFKFLDPHVPVKWLKIDIMHRVDFLENPRSALASITLEPGKNIYLELVPAVGMYQIKVTGQEGLERVFVDRKTLIDYINNFWIKVVIFQK